ncbi:MAG: YggS family pyridoxal phosphate-dependent enzyme [Stenotrophobium sp.]
MADISDNLLALRTRIAEACKTAGRAPESVRLLAVSKNFSARAIQQAMAAGQREFGENYLQEALGKIAQLPREGIHWHFIGPIQSNKTRSIAEHFDWVQSVDRLKIAQRLAEQRPASLPPLNVCVQVNISGEETKSGCAPDQAETLCRAVAQLPGLRLRGLMAIPAPAADADDPVPFRRLREIYENLRNSGLPLETLSIGMSDDYAAAIAEGSTMVRIGTALFGRRETRDERRKP